MLTFINLKTYHNKLRFWYITGMGNTIGNVYDYPQNRKYDNRKCLNAFAIILLDLTEIANDGGIRSAEKVNLRLS